jgi:hypothetical protein
MQPITQLKEIKAAENMVTYPAECIRFALQHISRYRMLTETETSLGYRGGVIYEPAIIMFFSFALTARKIAKLEQAKLHRHMRSEYKFVHLRLCYGLQSEADKHL